MKRKFFSMAAAACVALFSFSGLTGCSGGGSDENYGIVTLDDFWSARKGFKLMYGASSLEIMPISGSGENYETLGNQNANQNRDQRNGTRTVDCTVNGDYAATVAYTVAGWDPGVPVPGSGTQLVLSFTGDNIEKASKDPGIISATGGDYEVDKIISAVHISVDYTSYSGGSTVTFAYKKGDGTPATETVAVEGSFVVVRY